MRCFVTGSTGFIGSQFIRLLLAQDCHVGVLMRPGCDPWRIQDVLLRLHVIAGDLTTIGQAAPAVHKFGPEVIFHLGWYGVTSPHRNDLAQITQNLYGSLELLQVARDVGCKCWVGLGSQAEYGAHHDLLTEDSSLRPNSLYGMAKLSVGLLGAKLCEGYNIRFVWLRLLAAYGAMDDPSHLIPYVIQSLLKGEKPSLTSGEQRWDYLYVTDVARAILQVAICSNAQGIFNLCSGKTLSVRSIAECIRDSIDPSLPLGFGMIPHGPDQRMVLEADIRPLQDATGWTPQVSMDEGLRKTIDWYRSRR